MPANLTPVYKAAEQRYREAQDDEERLAALKEVLFTPLEQAVERQL